MDKRAFARWLALAVCITAAVPAQPQERRRVDTLARIQAEGVIRIGVRDNAPPFAYQDTAGRPAGFSWEVCRALVRELEVQLRRPIEIRTTPVSLPGSFEMLADGRIDLQCGSTTHTAERAQKVDFSHTFFVSGIVVSYRKDEGDYAHPLQFGRVGVVAGSTAEGIMKKRAARGGAARVEAVVPVPGYDAGVEMLKKKQIDTLFADSVLVPLDPDIARRGTLETVEPYALMLRKGDRAFGEQVDRALLNLLHSPAMLQMAQAARLGGKINHLTQEIWRRPSRDPAPQMY